MSVELDFQLHVISRKPFKDAAIEYPNQADALDRIYKVLRTGEFNNPDQLHAVFPSLDNFKYKDKWWVIDIGDNNFRLTAFIEFKDKRLFIKHIVSDVEYDKLCKCYAKSGDKKR